MVIENLEVNGKVHTEIIKEKKLDKNSVTIQASAGAIGGCATRFFCQPLDVLKIRFQVQIEPVSLSSNSGVYKGVFQGFTHIINNEGWFALWKGHVAAQILSISFCTFQFSLFESITAYVFTRAPRLDAVSPGVNFTAGVSAGCMATVIAYPFDTIRTRLVVQGEPKVYKGITDVISQMCGKEGALSLYRGLWPTLIQIGPYVGCQFALYRFLIEKYDEFVEKDSHNSLRSLSCGAIAGALSKTLVYPLDLTKKRLQMQGFAEKHNYKGLLDCLLITVKKEGPSALMKGLSPSLLKAFISSALQFYFYELSLGILSK